MKLFVLALFLGSVTSQAAPFPKSPELRCFTNGVANAHYLDVFGEIKAEGAPAVIHLRYDNKLERISGTMKATNSTAEVSLSRDCELAVQWGRSLYPRAKLNGCSAELKRALHTLKCVKNY